VKDERIMRSWDKIEPDSAADARMLPVILARKRELYEKQEQRNVFLLCLTQAAMFIMTLSVIIFVFIIDPVIAGALLICYIIIGGLIGLAFALTFDRNQKITEGSGL